jgi:ribosome biogenesis GTPase A
MNAPPNAPPSSPTTSGLFEQFNERRQAVIDGLEKLQTHAHAVGATTLGRRIGREVVDKLRADRFHLVVVGEFNHGKTTFVNALLGHEALPVGVTPTTAVIHHVSHADTPRATLVTGGDEKRELPFGELRSLAVGEGSQADVKHVEVGYPAELLRDRIVLVDTPGVNDLCLQRADITYKYIPQSDAVLFVIDAGQPLKESERLFLKEKLLGQSRDTIIFVVAKSDIWTEGEKKEALAYIHNELKKHIEGPVVFPVSAEKALAGDRAGSGMNELLAHLTAFLAEERGRILLGNAVGDGLRAARSIAHSIEGRRRAAALSLEDIQRRIARVELDLEGQKKTVEERKAAIREEAAAIHAWVRRDLDRFVDDVIRQLPDIIEKATVEELRVHLSGFLESTFVEWAGREAEEVARALEDLAENTVALMQDNAHAAAARLGAGVNKDVRAPDVRVDTLGYDLGVAALLSVGLGTFLASNLALGALMVGAAPILAYYLRGRVVLETKEKAREQAALALREAAAKVAPKLDKMVDEFCHSLEEWVTTAGKEVHQEMLDVLHAAKAARAVAAPSVADTQRDCDTLAAELGQIQKQLEGLLTPLLGAVHADNAETKTS